MNIRMLAFDIDGTLRGKKGFPGINCRALRECEKMGIKLVFCSGRSFESLREFAKEVGVNPLMASCNGARIDASINGPILAEFPCEEDISRRIYHVLRDSGLYYMALVRGKTYMCNAWLRPALGERYAHHIPGIVESDGYAYERVQDEERMANEGLKGTYKYVVMGDVYDPRFAGLREKLADLNLSVSSASKRNIEFNAPGVDKGMAVRFLAEREGIPMEEIMAFGDNTNDLPMLKAVGWPVAMENGEDVLKAAAKIIAPHHDEGGVGQVIEKYILNRR